MVKNRGQSRNGYRNILANVIFSVGEHSEVLQGSASKGTQEPGENGGGCRPSLSSGAGLQ